MDENKKLDSSLDVTSGKILRTSSDTDMKSAVGAGFIVDTAAAAAIGLLDDDDTNTGTCRMDGEALLLLESDTENADTWP